jgi:inorganic pyrophosphatase
MEAMTTSHEFLGKTLTIHIDRPLGSRHPQHGFIYPVNYGYFPGVVSGDGEEMDAYLLGVFEPVHEFTGVCIAIIHRLDDDDDKLVTVPEGRNFTDEQIIALTEFQERFFTSQIIR